jgi:hypothetical protein
MTGLDLATFLRLLRVDLALWLSFAAMVVLLGLMAWTTWGARRALRKCLVLSILIHLGLLAFGGQTEWGLRAFGPPGADTPPRERIETIRVTPEPQPSAGGAFAGSEGEGRARTSRPLAAWDQPGATLLAGRDPAPAIRPESPPPPGPIQREAVPLEPVAPDAGSPAVEPPTAAVPETRVAMTSEPIPPDPRHEPAEADAGELPAVAAAPRPAATSPDATGPLRASQRSALIRPGPGRPAGGGPPAARTEGSAGAADGMVALPATRDPGPAPARNGPATASALPLPDPTDDPPGADLAAVPPARPTTPAPGLAMPGTGRAARPSMPDRSGVLRPARPATGPGPIAFASPSEALSPPDFARGGAPSRAMPDVPEVYRSRLEPNRSQRAQRDGASAESEAAVERALVWLARHQDADGRWDAATARDASGAPVRGEDDYTIHCPPGDVCYGECHYWEADTALTGLALLAYLGAGYTHQDGKAHAQTVARGLKYLLSVQKPDGDLRGRSVAVGMYCHAMAALALCEAYALTRDPALQGPAERAVDFLVRSRAADGLSWRYAPGAPVGDTSILGWVILVLKSAREIGLPISANVQDGASRWLRLVSSGRDDGLARYQPGKEVTPTMTAEAWVCRQFLGIGGPGPASQEAADYLLEHGPGRDPYNIYYWYYGTLAMFQHGGGDWTRWNSQIRDQLVKRQKTTGHQNGSWDPDETQYGRFGGRIYTTALATLTLEVYYRYLRLYDQPGRRSQQPEEVRTAPVRRAEAGKAANRR